MKFSASKTPLTKSSSTGFQSFIYQNPLDQFDQNQTLCYKPFAPYVYGKPRFNAQDEQNLNNFAKQQYIQSLQQNDHLKNKKLIESLNPAKNQLYKTQLLQEPQYTQSQHLQLSQYDTATYEQPTKQLHDIITQGSIMCHIHQDQPVKNICIQPKCILPLCPVCVDLHGQFHKERNEKVAFEPLKDVTESLIQNVWNLRNEAEKQIKFMSQKIGENDNLQKMLDDQIEFVRQQIINAVDKIFNDFRNKCQQLQETAISISNAQHAKKLQDLSHLSTDLSQLQEKLLQPDELLHYTVTLLKSDVLPIISQYLAKKFSEHPIQMNCQMKGEFVNKLENFVQREVTNVVRQQEANIEQYENQYNEEELHQMPNLFTSLQSQSLNPYNSQQQFNNNNINQQQQSDQFQKQYGHPFTDQYYAPYDQPTDYQHYLNNRLINYPTEQFITKQRVSPNMHLINFNNLKGENIKTTNDIYSKEYNYFTEKPRREQYYNRSRSKSEERRNNQGPSRIREEIPCVPAQQGSTLIYPNSQNKRNVKYKPDPSFFSGTKPNYTGFQFSPIW